MLTGQRGKRRTREPIPADEEPQLTVSTFAMLQEAHRQVRLLTLPNSAVLPTLSTRLFCFDVPGEVTKVSVNEENDGGKEGECGSCLPVMLMESDVDLSFCIFLFGSSVEGEEEYEPPKKRT